MPDLPSYDGPFTGPDLDALHERTSVKWRAFGPDVLPSFVAEMDLPVAAPVAAALHAAVDRGDLGYAYPGALPQAFADYATAEQGWSPDPARIVLCGNVVVGIVEVLRACAPAGTRVVVSTPAYHPFLSVPAALGYEVVQVPLTGTADGYALDVDALEAAFAGGASAYLLCNPHNPTGSVPTAEQLAGVAAAARRHGVTVVADEIHAPLTLPGATFTAYGSLPADLVAGDVVVTSASKAWNLAGLKCALVAPAAAAPASYEVVAALPEELMYGVGHLGVVASVAAYREGGAWLTDVRSLLEYDRLLLGRLLAAELPAAGYHPPDASYLAWIDLRAYGLGDDPSGRVLAAGRLAVSAGPTFGAVGAGHVRLTFAAAPGVVAESVRRLARAVRGDPADGQGTVPGSGTTEG